MALTPSQREEMRRAVGSAIDEYRDSFTDEWLRYYLGFHRDRYQFMVVDLLDLLSGLPKPPEGQRMLDIGPRFEVGLFHKLEPSVRVDTLGLNSGLFPLNEGEQFTQFDLNDLDNESLRPQLGEGKYHAILMAEVIEHLWTAPELILPWLRSLLVPGGYLFVQTPNAVKLPNRIRMLTGRHPFEMLKADRSMPGHIREYTIGELTHEGQKAGFEVVSIRTANYFDTGSRSNGLYRRVSGLLPRTWRAGITVVYRRPSQ